MTDAGAREYGTERAIGSTLDFWEQRAADAARLGSLNVTMLQDGDESLAAARDRFEKDALLDRLAPTRESSVLDVGCGVGRWGHELIAHVDHYFGLDFSTGLIELGQQELTAAFPHGHWDLQVLSATDMHAHKLAVQPPFDKVIVSGLYLYMNDDDVRTSLQQMAALCARNATVVIKDSVAFASRLTLDRFYSDKLERDYSAIYRDEATFIQLFEQSLISAGFTLAESADLYPSELTNRAETAQHFFVLERSANG